MSRLTRLLVPVCAAAALVLPVSLLSVSANAADPVPTTTRVFVTDDGPGDVLVTARVSSTAGVPTGSVVFFNTGSADALGDPVPLDSTGAASQRVPRNGGISPFRAEFTGSGNFADSVGSVNPFGESLILKAEPTILKIGGPGLLKLTMTFAVRAYYRADGTPAAGQTILFTQKNVARGSSGHPEMDPNYVYPVEVCQATVDATGYATCRGSAAAGSIVTLLTTPSYANHLTFPVYQSVKLPPISLG